MESKRLHNNIKKIKQDLFWTCFLCTESSGHIVFSGNMGRSPLSALSIICAPGVEWTLPTTFTRHRVGQDTGCTLKHRNRDFTARCVHRLRQSRMAGKRRGRNNNGQHQQQATQSQRKVPRKVSHCLFRPFQCPGPTRSESSFRKWWLNISVKKRNKN